MSQDSITIEILDDGTIKTVTDGVSGANHSNAEQFLRYIAQLAGGESKRSRRIDVNQKMHVHEHEHGPETHEH